MDKRSVLFIILSMAVIIVWYAVFAPKQSEQPATPERQAPAPVEQAAADRDESSLPATGERTGAEEARADDIVGEAVESDIEEEVVLENDVLKELFEDVRIHLKFETDYILEPGASYVRMVTRISRLGSSEGAGECSEVTGCDLECPAGLGYDETGCPVCECAPEGVQRLTHFQESTSIFEGALGEATKGIPAGLVAGDFTFFGAQNDLFAPGMGFDEERAIFEPLFEGRDPFTYPLALDYMAAAGGAVSYGYFSVNPTGEDDPRVLVPIITSSTTAFSTSELRCAAEDTDCRGATQWEYERYLAVAPGGTPLAFANPIFVDADGDGSWQPPGLVEPLPEALSDPDGAP